MCSPTNGHDLNPARRSQDLCQTLCLKNLVQPHVLLAQSRSKPFSTRPKPTTDLSLPKSKRATVWTMRFYARQTLWISWPYPLWLFLHQKHSLSVFLLHCFLSPAFLVCLLILICLSVIPVFWTLSLLMNFLGHLIMFCKEKWHLKNGRILTDI